MRGICEPFNRHRRIVGFDTFKGFLSVSEKDGNSDMMKSGGLAVSENYVDYLQGIMESHENDNPLSHVRKYDLRAGDAVIEIDKSILKKILKRLSPWLILILISMNRPENAWRLSSHTWCGEVCWILMSRMTLIFLEKRSY